MKYTENIAGKYLQFSEFLQVSKNSWENGKFYRSTYVPQFFGIFLCIIVGISYCFLKKYSFNSLKKLVVTKILSGFLKLLKNRWGRCEIFSKHLRATVRKFSLCFFSEFLISFFLKNTDSNSVKQLLQSTWNFYRISRDFEM